MMSLSTETKAQAFDTFVRELIKARRLNLFYVLFHLDCVGVGGLDSAPPTNEDVLDDILLSFDEEVTVEICRAALPDLLIESFGVKKVEVEWEPNPYNSGGT